MLTMKKQSRKQTQYIRGRDLSVKKDNLGKAATIRFEEASRVKGSRSKQRIENEKSRPIGRFLFYPV